MTNQNRVQKSSLLIIFLVYMDEGSACWKRQLRTQLEHDKFLEVTSKLKHLDEKYSTCLGIDIREITIREVHKLFETNILTSVELTKCYLQRINQMNRYLKAVIEINPNALNEAKQADRERNSSQSQNECIHRSLHGIPILLKDNISTKRHMMTTAGSKALLGTRPIKDADVVKRLKKAGAVIIGKANLSELSGLRNYQLGWSSRGGQTLNPYNLNASPYGSSSGSATGVAANFALASLASETGGSLIAPASLAGVFGLKPTFGTVSNEGIIPVSRDQDCIGPMARTFMDLAIVFDTIVPHSHKEMHACGNSYASCFKEKYLRFGRKLRIGTIQHPYWNQRAMHRTVLTSQLPQLEELLIKIDNSSDLEIIPVISPPKFLQKISLEAEYMSWLYSIKRDLKDYLETNVTARYRSSQVQVKSLKDIIQFNIDNPDGHKQNILEEAENIDGYINSQEKYVEIRDGNKMGARNLLNSAFSEYELDALLFPNPLSPYPNERKNEYLHGSLWDIPTSGFSLAAIARYPSLNVPAGIGENGVPFGVTLVGLPDPEARLLQIGYYMESLNKARRPPKFLS